METTIWQTYPQDEVIVVGIINTSNQSHINNFIEENSLTFPILFDPGSPGGVQGGDTYNDYYLPNDGSPYPRDFIVDQEGILQYANNEIDTEWMHYVLNNCISDNQEESSAIEGRWIAEHFENTMYEFNGNMRLTYYCPVAVCDSVYWNSLDTSDALPTQNPYTFINDTLTIDLHFGNYSIEVVTFLCDSNVIDFNSQQSNLFRVGSNLDECDDYDGQQLDIFNLSNIPNQFELNQNYPNPFNSSTSIQYFLPKYIYVNINIYDLIGNHIKSLMNNYQNAGHNIISWDGTNQLGQSVSAGIYIYTIEAEEFNQSKKMLFLK